MSKFGEGWRAEKAQESLTVLCDFLERTGPIQTKIGDGTVDLRQNLRSVIHDVSKLLCEALEERYKDNNRWSPELVDYIFKHPEKWAATIKILDSEDYRDGYYDALK